MLRIFWITTLLLLPIWGCTGNDWEIPAPIPSTPSTPEEPTDPEDPETPADPTDPETGVIWVSSAEEVAALGEVKAGAEIVWRNGTYADQVVVLKAAGTAEKPVVLRAESPGEVRFSGTSRLQVKGSGVIVRGFWWQDPVPVRSKAVVTFDRGSSGCTLTQCAITGNHSAHLPEVDAKWVSLYGVNHTMEQCSLLDKRNMGTQVVVWLEESEQAPMPCHRILRNHFERPTTLYDEDGKALNGQETIRIGTSQTSMQDAACLVEGNYFYRCHGEQAEIISNKSCSNLYRGNLFQQSIGSLTLRHGNRCYVTGNYFLGDGLDGTGGVRIIGEDHTVENNYMAQLRGSGYKTAICLVRGEKNAALSGYWQVKRAAVRGNIIVDCRYAFQVNYGTSSQQMPVEESRIERNVVSLSSTSDYAVNYVADPKPSVEWVGNTLYGGRLSGIELPTTTEKPALPNVTAAVEKIRSTAGVSW